MYAIKVDGMFVPFGEFDTPEEIIEYLVHEHGWENVTDTFYDDTIISTHQTFVKNGHVARISTLEKPASKKVFEKIYG